MAKYCVISLGIPVKTPVKLVDKIFKGMNDLAREFKFNIVGGDISRAPKIIIDVSMVGIVKKKHLALRSSACKGDIIFVTGSLGGSIKGKHLNFTPRIKEARFLAENFRVAAMIDISDGLLADLSHILEESNVGGVIYEELIPVSDKASGFQDALTSGEDFELLFTLPRREALRLLRRRVVNFKPIGEILDMKYGFKLINKDYKLINLSSKGYRHF
jgi:thiamine-monophosphate kinase